MSDQNMIHKDLKPQNILLHFPNVGNIMKWGDNKVWLSEVQKARENWTINDDIIIKITDFGLTD